MFFFLASCGLASSVYILGSRRLVARLSSGWSRAPGDSRSLNGFRLASPKQVNNLLSNPAAMWRDLKTSSRCPLHSRVDATDGTSWSNNSVISINSLSRVKNVYTLYALLPHSLSVNFLCFNERCKNYCLSLVFNRLFYGTFFLSFIHWSFRFSQGYWSLTESGLRLRTCFTHKFLLEFWNYQEKGEQP